MIGLVVAVALAHGAPAAAAPSLVAELGRLAGHRVTVAPDGASYHIDDVAGEGSPLVGIVERRSAGLFLVTADAVLLLTGPLARPRIAGPGYRVWVVGKAERGDLHARRIGVLAPPPRRPPARE